MPIDCQRSTSGGKGNIGMFIERDSKICAAGIPSAQPDDKVRDCFQMFLLKDEVDALISDALVPDAKPKPLPPLRRPIPLDKRYSGPFTAVAELINTPRKGKFQYLADDFKDTVYSSYWKKPISSVPDSIPMLPEGFDVHQTFGKKTPFHGRLYDIVMPKEPYPDKTPRSKHRVQKKRIYCAPYDSDLTYGHRYLVDKRGTYGKCCVTDDRIVLGNNNRTLVSDIQSNFRQANMPKIGTVLAPNNNIANLPEGHSFGKLKPPDNLPECLTTCQMNLGRHEFKDCLKALNTLRICLKKRALPNTFFRRMYLSLRYVDKENTGWLPKDVVYKFCGTKFIRFDPAFIEPLLSSWRAFDGSNIQYETFFHIINYREHLPHIVKVPDLPDDCLNFETTYREMVKPDKEHDPNHMAGLPSGRYFDLDLPITPARCTKADRICLPHESDMKSCLSPSVLTLLFVNHRDMYAKREPDVVKRVFEPAYGKLTEEKFDSVWESAKKQHSQGWVCYETFRKALEDSMI